ncbi:hypothetical protein Glove_437g22 [Diversispora epigaea]|uniref:Uncharacterized protein n=1 Tax=Diversispora epigaea TaxID=1348612 RepID=A0A397GRW4_9GLOM|nr:hypothetical protein Glove_437g22 [Diversispora epigaea]
MQQWKIIIQHCNGFLWPLYNTQELLANHKNNKSYNWQGLSKMRVDLVKHTLVEDALESIKELKEISKGTKVHDERLHTLKEIRNWFIYSNKQKSGSKAWISSQCQFDLILFINGFIRILDFLLKKYPESMIQSKRISQDMFEGLFGTIHKLGEDSSTHTLKFYGYSLNKYQLLSLFSREVKSINYRSTNCIGTGITTLARSDHQKNKRKFLDKENNQEHHTRLMQILLFSHTIFEDLLSENLIMGRIDILLNLYNENVNSENFKILQLQKERYDLIEIILYQDSINKLLKKWKDIIKKMACETIPKRIGVQCSSTQKLVAYLLLQKVIKYTFSKNTMQNNSNNYLSVDSHFIPNETIILEPTKVSKFSYIIGWIIYKLTKSDNIMKSHPKFEAMCAHFKVLSSEQIVYEQDVRSQITNVIPESFITIFNISDQILYTHNFTNTEKHELTKETKKFLYKQIISIYMRSRQKF